MHIVLILLLGAAVAYGDSLQCSSIAPPQRRDCQPDVKTPTQAKCSQRSCCWAASQNGSPPCYYGKTFDAYKPISHRNTTDGFHIVLERSKKPSPFPNDVERIHVDFTYESENRVRLRITDPAVKRWETPFPPRPRAEAPPPSHKAYKLNIVKDDPFAFEIIRRSDGSRLFSTDVFAPLIFSDQFIELHMKLGDGVQVFGLGEGTVDASNRKNPLFLSNAYTHNSMWNRNHTVDDSSGRGQPSYGAQPIFMGVANDGSTFGQVMINSNALDVHFQPDNVLTWRLTGGIVDLYLLTGPRPLDVSKQISDVVGRPALPPFWALGYQLSKSQWGSTNNFIQAWVRNSRNKMPVDTLYTDTEMMDEHKDFTLARTWREAAIDGVGEESRLDGVAALVRFLHSKGLHVLPVLEPGIASDEPAHTYPPYERGMAANIFIRDNTTANVLQGRFWSGKRVAFPDFSHPNSSAYWANEVRQYERLMPLDGLWLDNDEPTNFVDGSVNGCASSSNENRPPFLPPLPPKATLQSATVCPDARQHASSHYNLHNLYATQMAIATREALIKSVNPGDLRPFVLSRGNFIGHGQVGGVAIGHDESTYEDLKKSIRFVLTYAGLYQIPMAAANVCGYYGQTTQALCIRWHQAAVFFPMMRNHNGDARSNQDPASFHRGTRSSLNKALSMRQNALPFIWTKLVRAHLFGEPVIRPMFYEEPQEEQARKAVDQYMLGDDTIVVVATERHVSSVQAYLPPGLWWFGKGYHGGQTVTIPTPKNIPAILRRAGSISVQTYIRQTAMASHAAPFYFIIILADDGSAQGELYWDDGLTLDAYAPHRNFYNHQRFNATRNSHYQSVKGDADYIGLPQQEQHFELLLVYNVPHRPDWVSWNGRRISSFSWSNKRLVITRLYQDMLDPWEIRWDLD